MSDDPVVTNADDQKLIELIGQSQRRILYMAPGITEAVAQAIMSAWQRLPTGQITVIIDVDPEICRLGYGTVEGLKAIFEAAKQMEASVCQQPGVRIGLLISDDTTLVYSPSPLLIEAEANQPARPNAIQLQSAPAELTKSIGLEKTNDGPRSVGGTQILSEQVDRVEADLKNNPPARFDLARRVKVFTSRFQFVELEMTGCYISRKKVPIPSSLMGLASDKDLQSRFHAQFNLTNSAKLDVKTGDRTLTEEALRKKKDSIVKDLLIPLKGYGNVVLRGNKEKLQNAIDDLRSDVIAFRDGIKQSLQGQMDDNSKALVKALLPAVKQNPPSQYTKIHGPKIDEIQLRALLDADIKAAFGEAGKLVSDMTVSLIFKDLAYESLVDEDFLAIARKAMPGVQSLHEENQAVNAQKPEETR